VPQGRAPQFAAPPTCGSLSWALRRSAFAVQHSYPARITGPAVKAAGPVSYVDSLTVAWQRGRISRPALFGLSGSSRRPSSCLDALRKTRVTPDFTPDPPPSP